MIAGIDNNDFRPRRRWPMMPLPPGAPMNESQSDRRLRYTTVAIALHWTVAVLILVNLAVGFVMEGLAPPLKSVVVPFHFSCGMTVLALSALRLAWRLSHRAPALPLEMPAWERACAHGAHAALYVLMILMPIIGWCIISAHPPRAQGAASIWGVLRLPAISRISHLAGPAQKAAHAWFVDAHTAAAWVLLGMLALHVAGALKHQWFDGRPELARMGIGRRG
jgi:cytochrome b561